MSVKAQVAGQGEAEDLLYLRVFTKICMIADAVDKIVQGR